jgi:hypothetical protein
MSARSARRNAPATSKKQDQLQRTAVFGPGDVVRHKQWGRGTVREVDPDGSVLVLLDGTYDELLIADPADLRIVPEVAEAGPASSTPAPGQPGPDGSFREAAEFLRRRFASARDELFVLVWAKKGKHSDWFRVSRLNKAEHLLRPFCERDAGDVYVGVALSPNDFGPKNRCKAEDIAGIVAFWIDIDIRHDAHKRQDLPATREEALDLLQSFPLEPTEIVDSGHGLHVWWLLVRPWLFQDENEREKAASLSRRFQHVLKQIAKARGWYIDSTADLPRILRLPGTFNHKPDDRVPVRMLRSDGPRYTLSQLRDAVRGRNSNRDTDKPPPRDTAPTNTQRAQPTKTTQATQKTKVTQTTTEVGAERAEGPARSVARSGSTVLPTAHVGESSEPTVLPSARSTLRSARSELPAERSGSAVFTELSELSREVQEEVEDAITNTQPTNAGERHHHIFQLCRRLKAIPALADAEVRVLRPIVVQWHARAKDVIGTKEFATTWADFIDAWKKVKYAAGEGPVDKAFARATAKKPPRIAVELYGDEPIVQLAALCRELQRLAGDDEFFLDCRTAGRLLGVSHKTASQYLRALRIDGILKCVETGSRQSRRASSYRYLPGREKE